MTINSGATVGTPIGPTSRLAVLAGLRSCRLYPRLHPWQECDVLLHAFPEALLMLSRHVGDMTIKRCNVGDKGHSVRKGPRWGGREDPKMTNH